MENHASAPKLGAEFLGTFGLVFGGCGSAVLAASDFDHLSSNRRRGSLLARGIAQLPVIGLDRGWLDEHGGIRKAAKQINRLLR